MSLQARRGTDLDVFLHSAIRLDDDGEKKVQHAPAALTLSTQIVHVCPAQVRQFVIDSQCITLRYSSRSKCCPFGYMENE